MAEEPEDSERPRDEAWWESELHRNEKLMDKYMAVLGDNPDWDKWQDPEDLYNKVHFNIDPPERGTGETEELEESGEAKDTGESSRPISEDEPFFKELNEPPGAAPGEPDWEDPDEDPEVNLDYESISGRARKFAGRIFDLEKMPGNAELLCLSAGKVGANLAGGHGLGYDESSLCGNIVKCRWALSDCEFCREMLDQLHQQTGQQVYADLAEESRQLAEVLRERIARLRQRVWW